MIRKSLTVLALLLSAVTLALAAFLLRPGDVFEMLVGFAAGTLGTAQASLLALSVFFLALSFALTRPPDLLHKRVATAITIAAALIAIYVTIRDHKAFTRQSITIAANDVSLAGTIYTPRDKNAQHPAILILHGSGPFKRDAYHLFARRFAARGFVVLNMDKRGVGASTGKYTGDDLGHGVIEQRTRDAMPALQYLTTLADVDTARIGVFSMSQGGWVVSQLLDGASPARFAIVFSGVAVSSAEEGQWSDWAGEDNDHFGFKPPPIPFDEINQRMRTVLPGDFNPRPALQRMVAPTIWMFGEWDSSAPTAASLRVIDSLRARGIPIESHVFPEANHGLAVVRGPRGKRNADFAPGLWEMVFAWTDHQHITSNR